MISVIVVTYNFQNIILECLEGIKKQSYNDIELIISDDCSKDKTVDVCKKWLESNSKFFKRIELLTSKENQGVVKNINKGLKAARGECIKIIAGDDILVESSLEKFMNYLNKNQNAEIIFSQVQSFRVKDKEKLYLEVLPDKEMEQIFNMSQEEQLKILLECNFLAAPSSFFKKSLFEKYGYFDERFKMVEDYPYWIKLLKNKVKLYYMPEVTVYYRKSESSISAIMEGKINPTMLEFEEQFYNLIYKKEVKNIFKKWDRFFNIFISKKVLKNDNKRTFFLKIYGKAFRSKNLKRLFIVLTIGLISIILNR